MSTGSDDPVAELEAAAERLERLEADPPVDPDDVDTVANAYESVVRVLDRWEERATDWDDFEGYVEFRDDLSETMSSIPEDVPEGDAFLEADGHVKTGGVSTSLTTEDFDVAREALAPAREYADYRDDLEAARRRYRRACRAAEDRHRALEGRIEDLERLRRLGEADLEAPVERLRDPVERYDEAVGEAFEEFRREAPAREFLDLVETAAGCPLVDVDHFESTTLVRKALVARFFQVVFDRLPDHGRSADVRHRLGVLHRYLVEFPNRVRSQPH